MGPSPARAAALVALRRIEQRRGFSNRVLGEVLEQRPELDRRDRGLATTLVYGVLRHRARLDHLVDAIANRPHKIKGELREVLRMAAYEIRELHRPVAIVGSETTALTRRIDPSGRLRGLVTALVSGLDRRGAQLDRDADSREASTALAQRWSIPPWLAERWVAELGTSVARMRAKALASPPWLDLRIDLHRTTREMVLAALADDHPHATVGPTPDEQPQCVRLRGAGDIFYGPLHDRGHVSVQSLGSQQAVRLLDLQPGERVLDACAGLGVKSLQIAECLRRRGALMALDIDPAKLEWDDLRVRGELDVADLDLFVCTGDLRDWEPERGGGEGFDAILLDAPCTGLGDLARHPEIRWRCRPDDLSSATALQAALLRAAAGKLHPRGRLVYAVCSLEPEEGPELVARVAPAAGLQVERIASYTPETHDADGFFCARLIRA